MNAYNVTIKIIGKGLVTVKPRTVTGLAIAKNKENAGLSALALVKKSLKIKGDEAIELIFEIKKVISVPAAFIVNDGILGGQ